MEKLLEIRKIMPTKCEHTPKVWTLLKKGQLHPVHGIVQSRENGIRHPRAGGGPEQQVAEIVHGSCGPKRGTSSSSRNSNGSRFRIGSPKNKVLPTFGNRSINICVRLLRRMASPPAKRPAWQRTGLPKTTSKNLARDSQPFWDIRKVTSFPTCLWGRGVQYSALIPPQGLVLANRCKSRLSPTRRGLLQSSRLRFLASGNFGGSPVHYWALRL